MAGGDFNPEVVETPVLIIGAGAAGLRVAIELAQREVPCLVIGKRRHGDAHTRMAAGGINAAFANLDSEDRWEIHAADTIREGHFICQPRAVELLCREAPRRVRELQEWGCEFDLTVDGKINQRYFGAQSFRRTCFVGDRTGEAILQALVERAKGLKVQYREGVFVTKLLRNGGRVVGACGYEIERGRPLVFRAAAVVLAAGGCTSLYARSSSRAGENTGDAMALAYEAGAQLRDMEFIQFHPTGMIKPEEMKGRLVTEAVRGEGGHLLNAQGERFMERYSPEHMELDARDVVARANYEEIQDGRGTPDGGVLLDISHRPADYIRERLPKIVRQFEEHGVDITKEPMEVAPTAHYPMGGVKVDFETGRSTVPGLYAVGEASGGLHGANRLGGNSLAETVVFGARTGAHLADMVGREPAGTIGEAEVRAHLSELDQLYHAGGRLDPIDVARQVGRLMWDHAGIVRTRRGLREGLEKLQEIRQGAADIAGEGDRTGRTLEFACNLRFMLPVAEMILRCAAVRDESRGAHFLKDCPQDDPAWQKNIVLARGEAGGMRLWTEGVPPVPQEIEKALGEHHSLDYHHLE
jgi:succinate dehydrogenase / fumarate reductase, flavoprotein subunit